MEELNSVTSPSSFCLMRKRLEILCWGTRLDCNKRCHHQTTKDSTVTPLLLCRKALGVFVESLHLGEFDCGCSLSAKYFHKVFGFCDLTSNGCHDISLSSVSKMCGVVQMNSKDRDYPGTCNGNCNQRNDHHKFDCACQNMIAGFIGTILRDNAGDVRHVSIPCERGECRNLNQSLSRIQTPGHQRLDQTFDMPLIRRFQKEGSRSAGHLPFRETLVHSICGGFSRIT